MQIICINPLIPHNNLGGQESQTFIPCFNKNAIQFNVAFASNEIHLLIIIILKKFSLDFYREHHPKQQQFFDVLEMKSDIDFFKHLRLTRTSFKKTLELIETSYVITPPGTVLYLGPKSPPYFFPWISFTSHNPLFTLHFGMQVPNLLTVKFQNYLVLHVNSLSVCTKLLTFCVVLVLNTLLGLQMRKPLGMKIISG